MAMDYVDVADKIIANVGGKENIASATHCMTRLRLVLADEGKANDDAVKAIKGVKSVIKQGGQYQVVIGNEVSNLFKEFQKRGLSEDGGAAPKKVEGNPVQRLFGFVSGCMTPMLPAMLGCGMLKVVLTLLTTFCGMDATSSTYTLIFSFADCFFMFLPIFLGFTIAKKMNGNPMLYMAIGAALCYPELSSLMNGATVELGTFLGMNCTYLFGIPVICASYTSSVLPMLLMAPVMKWSEDFADRVSPNVLKAFLKPLIFIIICIPCSLYVLGPIGNVCGNLLSGGFMIMYNAAPWLTVGVLSALMPFIVMTGMHYALIPLCMNNMATLGFDVIVLVTMFCSNLAQGGASLGVAMKTKDTETKSEGIACGISAIVAGVTEPAMYGINFRFMKPMIGAVAGALVGGLWCGITAVKGYTMGGSPSILSLITFIDTTPDSASPMHSVIFGAIGAVLVLVIAFVLSFILFKDEVAPEAPVAAPEPEAPKTADALVEKIVLAAPMTGEVVSIKDVPDPVFSGGVLGDGAAIIPTVGKVVAPCDCTVVSTMDTKHAIGLEGPKDMEILIHVGLNTVELGGKYFEYKVAEGDSVKKGDTLIEFDLEAIKAAGYKMHTPVLVSNADDYVSIKTVAEGQVKAGTDLLSIV